MQYFVRIEEGEEKDLETAVASQGPIAVMVDASHNIFRVRIIYFYTFEYDVLL